jgi:hypothetical protein
LVPFRVSHRRETREKNCVKFQIDHDFYEAVLGHLRETPAEGTIAMFPAEQVFNALRLLTYDDYIMPEHGIAGICTSE